MKKFIFGIVAIIVVGIVVVSLPKQGKEEDKPIVEAGEETIEDDDGFCIEALSDKDIYFKADTVLPDNPAIHDMMIPLKGMKRTLCSGIKCGMPISLSPTNYRADML